MVYTHRALQTIPMGAAGTIEQGALVDASGWPNKHLLERNEMIERLTPDEQRAASAGNGRAHDAEDAEDVRPLARRGGRRAHA